MLTVYARLCIYVPVRANSGRSILSWFYGIRVFIVLPNFRCITMPSTVNRRERVRPLLM